MDAVQKEYDELLQYCRLLPFPHELQRIIIDYEGTRERNIPVFLIRKWEASVFAIQYPEAPAFHIRENDFIVIDNVAAVMYETMLDDPAHHDKFTRHPLIIIHGMRWNGSSMHVYVPMPQENTYGPCGRDRRMEGRDCLVPWAFRWPRHILIFSPYQFPGPMDPTWRLADKYARAERMLPAAPVPMRGTALLFDFVDSARANLNVSP